MRELTIIGSLGKNPETKNVGQHTVCEFSVATNSGREEPPVWFKVVVWNKMGDNCAKFLSKGKKVAVVGTLGVDEWQKDGEKRYALTVNASKVEFLTPKDESGTAPAPQNTDLDSIPF